MGKLSQAHLNSVPQPKRSIWLAKWCAYLSGIVSILGVIFLVVFYALYFTKNDGMGFGELNDSAVVIQYIMMLPIAFVLHSLLRTGRNFVSTFSLFIGIIGMLAVIVLQIMLLARILPFAVQINFVSIAFIVVAFWFVINRHLGRSGNIVPKSMFLTIMAGLYFGYPVWAFLFGRKLNKLQDSH